MALEEIGARLALKERPQFSREAERAARDIHSIGGAAKKADVEGRGAFNRLHAGATGAFGGIMRNARNVGGLLGIGGITVAMGEGVKSAMDYQKIQAQTGAVLKSTHQAAGVSAEGVKGLAEQISNYSGIQDESIQKGENLLLTFTGIRNSAGKNNDMFNQTTKVMTDMSVAMGTDAFTSALQLGKALNEPAKGVNMLRRVGVSFTEDQIKQIKTLQAHGKTVEAQKLMLGELSKEFGGSAKAAGQTFSGALNKAKNATQDFLRDLMMPALPVFTSGLTWLTRNALPWMERGLKEVGKYAHVFFDALQNKNAISQFHGGLAVAYQVGERLRAGLKQVKSALSTLWKEAIVPIARVIWSDLIPAVKNLWTFLMPGLWSAIKMAAAVVIGGLVLAFKILGPALKAATGFLKDHKVAITTILIPIATVYGLFKAWTLATKVWTAVTKAATVAQKLFNTAMKANTIGIIVGLIIGLAAAFIYAYKHSATFRHIVQGALHAVESAAKHVWNWLKDNWPYLLGILMGPFGLAVGWIIKHWTKVKGFFTGLPGVLKSIGSDITNALFWPFKTAFNLIADAWNNTAGKLHFHIPHWVPKIGGDGFSMPTIPKLHNGGEVTRGGLINMLPGEEVVALPAGARVMPIDGPAATAPLSPIAGGGDGQPIVLQLVVDRKVLAEQTYRHTRDKVARS